MKIEAPIWQKRFKKRIAEDVLNFASSIEDDQRLIPYDIMCSRAHARMLKNQKIISSNEFKKIDKGLKRILADYKKGRWRLLPEYEDVHMNVERQLQKLIGSAALRLHTARSRNDLIATDLRLYTRHAVAEIMGDLIDVQIALQKKSQRYLGVVMPGYTHLQHAQPILFSFYLLSYFYKFQRDYECLKDTVKRIDISPLGAGALAGTSHNIDREYTAALLNFKKISENSLDSITDRDFLCEIFYCLTQIMLHISSLAEDLIIFTTSEFNLVELDDSVTTGSSIMPQKKNPDVCELIRARAGKAIGNLTAALTILKGLPSSYNRDLQELKGILFRQIDDTLSSLKMTQTIITTLRIDPSDKWTDWANKENLICASDLVDFMVKKGYKFRHAYNIIAECVKNSKGEVGEFIRLCAKRLRINHKIILEILKPKCSVGIKISAGGTGIKETKSSIAKAIGLIKLNKNFLNRSKKFFQKKKF